MSQLSLAHQARIALVLALLSIHSEAAPLNVVPRAPKSSGSKTTNNYYYGNLPTTGDWWHRNKSWVISISVVIGVIILVCLGFLLFACLGYTWEAGGRAKQRMKAKMARFTLRRGNKQDGAAVGDAGSYPEHDRASLATTAVDHGEGSHTKETEHQSNLNKGGETINPTSSF